MDYQKHYDLLISRAKNRTLIGYSEKHHIMPRCLGGSDAPENLVRLTPEEHFLAHQLLMKLNVSSLALARAAVRMTVDKYGMRVNNKCFGWIKRRLSKRMSERTVSEETKSKISAALRGKSHPNSGWSTEAKLRKSLSMIGEGNNQFGKKRSEATLKKMSKSIAGEKHPLFGKRGAACHKFGTKMSEEQKRTISGSLSGRKRSPEAIAKFQETMKNKRQQNAS